MTAPFDQERWTMLQVLAWAWSYDRNIVDHSAHDTIAQAANPLLRLELWVRADRAGWPSVPKPKKKNSDTPAAELQIDLMDELADLNDDGATADDTPDDPWPIVLEAVQNGRLKVYGLRDGRGEQIEIPKAAWDDLREPTFEGGSGGTVRPRRGTTCWTNLTCSREEVLTALLPPKKYDESGARRGRPREHDAGYSYIDTSLDKWRQVQGVEYVLNRDNTDLEDDIRRSAAQESDAPGLPERTMFQRRIKEWKDKFSDNSTT
ncbi:MAG: hypothetical protein RIM84_24580 [Alphaproteobacteria bacterium]